MGTGRRPNLSPARGEERMPRSRPPPFWQGGDIVGGDHCEVVGPGLAPLSDGVLENLIGLGAVATGEKSLMRGVRILIEYQQNEARPGFECSGFLWCVSCTIVDSCDSTFCSTDVIETGFNNMRRDADFIHAGRASSPQIVQDPCRW